jgi:hypothetical protein
LRVGSRFYACSGFSFALGSKKENGREKLPAVSRGTAATAYLQPSYFSPAVPPLKPKD